MIEIAKLPANATATDVIDMLSDAIVQMILQLNARRGVSATADEVIAAHGRVFPVALTELLARIDAQRPELGARIRDHFMREQEEWMAVGVSAAVPSRDAGDAARLH